MNRPIVLSAIPILSGLLLACSYHSPYLSMQGRGAIDLPDCRVAYVTDYHELAVLKSPRKVSYIGTWKDHHIMVWRIIFSPSPDAVVCYAIPSSQFSPDSPFEYGAEGNQAR